MSDLGIIIGALFFLFIVGLPIGIILFNTVTKGTSYQQWKYYTEENKKRNK